jgi:integrase
MTELDTKTGAKVAQNLSKTDVRYWQAKVFRRETTVNGKRYVSPEWSARFQHDGQRRYLPLGTPNKAAAAAKARDMYIALRSRGWGALDHPRPVERKDGSGCSVGEFLQAVQATSSVRPRTVAGYSASLRQIVSDIFGYSNSKAKYDYRKGGQEKWRKEVEAVSLGEVTAERIQDWKKSFLAKAGKGVIAQRRAKVSVNSIMRQARSLFSPKLLRRLKLSLPNPLPFSGIEFEPRQTMKYQSKIDVLGLVQDARKELAGTTLESYKIFLLAVTVGLRRKEIDLLEWSSFRWNDCLIRIQPTDWFHPKSEESLADLPVEPEVMELFRQYHTRGSGRFVIKCRRPPQPRTSQQYYRCAPHFDKLIEWLRDHGVDGNKPLHTLRKEYGSLITQAHGIYAASRALRHTDLRTTSEHYVDSRSRATPGLGHLLAVPS